MWLFGKFIDVLSLSRVEPHVVLHVPASFVTMTLQCGLKCGASPETVLGHNPNLRLVQYLLQHTHNSISLTTLERTKTIMKRRLLLDDKFGCRFYGYSPYGDRYTGTVANVKVPITLAPRGQ